MRTWEAHQSNRKAGKTRKALAKMIEAALPGVFICPEDLQVQNPQYSRAEVDACSWDAWGSQDGHPVHFYSWSTMGRIVKSGGVIATKDGHQNYEIDPQENNRK